MNCKLEVGYSKREITPPLGSALAGRPMLMGRLAKTARDSLFARAAHIESQCGHVTILVADLLLVTRSLHLQIARASGCPAQNLLVLATHTHSGPGGYWKGKHIEPFMGPYSPDTQNGLAACLVETVREAALSTSPAELSVTSIEVTGMSTNRRQANGPIDPVLTLLRFDVEGDRPVCVASFGAHPIVGLERQPFTITADYPGEICGRLERLGLRPIFIQGACGGTSPAHIRLPLETHLARVGDAFESKISAGLTRMESCAAPRIIMDQIPLGIASAEARITPDGLPFLRAVEERIRPLRRYFAHMARQGMADNKDLALTVVDLGCVQIVGVPGEVGPELSLSIRKVFSNKQFKHVIVASLCNGYAGYIHKRSDYRYRRGTHALGLYENAMSLAGRDAGDSILSVLERRSLWMAP